MTSQTTFGTTLRATARTSGHSASATGAYQLTRPALTLTKLTQPALTRPALQPRSHEPRALLDLD